jgi:Holliday junction resolvase
MPSGFGIERERQLVKRLREEGWFAMRAPASLGVCDVVALKKGEKPIMVEAKGSSAGPLHSFGPADRRALSEAAHAAGAVPWLVWWPKRSKPTWISENEWPRST